MRCVPLGCHRTSLQNIALCPIWLPQDVSIQQCHLCLLFPTGRLQGKLRRVKFVSHRASLKNTALLSPGSQRTTLYNTELLPHRSHRASLYKNALFATWVPKDVSTQQCAFALGSHRTSLYNTALRADWSHQDVSIKQCVL